MITVFALVLLMSAQQSGPVPAMTVDYPQTPSVTAGAELPVTVHISVSADTQGTAVLLPLELENISVTGQQQVVTRLADSTEYTWHLTLAAAAAGNGLVGEFQAEMRGDDEQAEPLLLTHPGFTVQISQPFRWSDAWPWLLIIVVAGGVIALAAARARRAAALREKARTSSPAQERRARAVEELERLRIRAEWRKLVDSAYGALLREIEFMAGTSSNGTRVTAADMYDLGRRWPDLPAAYRLGEEVRYGGHQPDKKEAGFMTGFVRRVFADCDREEEEQREEQTR